MAILVTSKYEEDLIKIESARVATTLHIDFSNTQGQITSRSVTSKNNSLLLPRIKKIRIKMKALEWPQH